jgi:hypothetical protein
VIVIERQVITQRATLSTARKGEKWLDAISTHIDPEARGTGSAPKCNHRDCKGVVA